MTDEQNTSHSAQGNAELGLERIIFFSDAVMAIAITLLTIDLQVPQIAANVAAAQLPEGLLQMASRFASFLISFLVIGIFWMSHHRYFGFIKRFDGRLMLMNLIFLLFIALMPFTASLLGQYSQLPIAVGAYSLDVAALGLALWGCWSYAAHNHRLIDQDLDPRLIREMNLRATLTPLLFLISVPMAWVNVQLTITMWWLSPFISAAAQYIQAHRS